MITFKNVTKRFSAGHAAVEDLSFEVKEGEILVFLGRSGSGKTTALRLINRLIEPTDGEICFKGEDIRTLDPIDLRRQIGYAIQHIGLFPHMSVEENIGIVPKLLHWSEEKIKLRVDELLLMVGLEPEKFSGILPAKLSGGQKQRIGVARALAADPPVILMDEPFGALDPLMREQLQNEFLEIQSRIQKTIVFVTHDLSEAVKMGDRIAILDKGKLIQIATPEELLHNPASDFIDQFLGKDRFQLLLQTKSLRYFLSEKKKKGGRGILPVESSLMDALKTFKLTGSDTLDVMDCEACVGQLHKDKLLESLIESL